MVNGGLSNIMQPLLPKHSGYTASHTLKEQKHINKWCFPHSTGFHVSLYVHHIKKKLLF